MKSLSAIHTAFKDRYPHVDNDDFSVQHSGYVHEHPMTAIGVVLISSIALGTIDIGQLSEFTKYSCRFIKAISRNMENSGLWKDGKYDCARWSSGNLLPRTQHEDDEFWDDIQVAAGDLFTEDAKSFLSDEACMIFWNEKTVN